MMAVFLLLVCTPAALTCSPSFSSSPGPLPTGCSPISDLDFLWSFLHHVPSHLCFFYLRTLLSQNILHFLTCQARSRRVIRLWNLSIHLHLVNPFIRASSNAVSSEAPWMLSNGLNLPSFCKHLKVYSSCLESVN